MLIVSHLVRRDAIVKQEFPKCDAIDFARRRASVGDCIDIDDIAARINRAAFTMTGGVRSL